MTIQRSVAKKYATAFLNVYNDSFSLQDYQQLIKTTEYIKKHYSLLVLLSVPTLSRLQKKECLEKFLAVAQAPSLLERLAHLLLEQQRIESLGAVCEQLLYEYQERKKIMPFILKSSEPLKNDQIALLIAFLAKKTGNTISYTTATDKKLIAGIRMQSDAFLWEHSIEQQLRTLRKNDSMK